MLWVHENCHVCNYVTISNRNTNFLISLVIVKNDTYINIKCNCA